MRSLAGCVLEAIPATRSSRRLWRAPRRRSGLEPFIGWSGAAGKLSRISKSNLRPRDWPDAKYLYELGIEDPRLVVSESHEARRSQAVEQSSEPEPRGPVSTWHPCLRQFEIWQLPSARAADLTVCVRDVVL
jgi:hypothetical protein